jgi:hypothetical protein
MNLSAGLQPMMRLLVQGSHLPSRHSRSSAREGDGFIGIARSRSSVDIPSGALGIPGPNLTMQEPRLDIPGNNREIEVRIAGSQQGIAAIESRNLGIPAAPREVPRARLLAQCRRMRSPTMRSHLRRSNESLECTKARHQILRSPVAGLGMSIGPTKSRSGSPKKRFV